MNLGPLVKRNYDSHDGVGNSYIARITIFAHFQSLESQDSLKLS